MKNDIMIVIYVNDLIFTKFDLVIIFWLKNVLHKRFEMSNLRLCIYYFDMMIVKNRRLRFLILNQSVYVEQMLQDHEMWNCKSLVIFMNVSCRLIKIFDEYIADKNLRTSYQLIVKSLIYIMLKIRSDIVYFISMISRYVFNLTQIHWQTIKRTSTNSKTINENNFDERCFWYQFVAIAIKFLSCQRTFAITAQQLKHFFIHENCSCKFQKHQNFKFRSYFSALTSVCVFVLERKTCF
jgi:hypothetical protein